MTSNPQVDYEESLKDLRNLLPYLKDWSAWQREIRRLERNIVKLRRHRYAKLARTLAKSLPRLRSVLDKEKMEHAFTINKLIARLNEKDKKSVHHR